MVADIAQQTAGEPGYARLPGRSFASPRRPSVWLASDHVLVVHETLTGERYRRFFFRDIKAITVRATSRRARLGWVLVGLGLVNLLPLLALAADDSRARSFAWFSLGAVACGILALVNLVRGPTCETRLVTAVQDEVVLSLGRRTAARRVVALLQPRILAAQAVAGETSSAPTVEGDVR